jgi:hypothetical protein
MEIDEDSIFLFESPFKTIEDTPELFFDIDEDIDIDGHGYGYNSTTYR